MEDPEPYHQIFSLNLNQNPIKWTQAKITIGKARSSQGFFNHNFFLDQQDLSFTLSGWFFADNL